jgi:hypothetical protein
MNSCQLCMSRCLSYCIAIRTTCVDAYTFAKWESRNNMLNYMLFFWSLYALCLSHVHPTAPERPIASVFFCGRGIASRVHNQIASRCMFAARVEPNLSFVRITVVCSYIVCVKIQSFRLYTPNNTLFFYNYNIVILFAYCDVCCRFMSPMSASLRTLLFIARSRCHACFIWNACMCILSRMVPISPICLSCLSTRISCINDNIVCYSCFMVT